MFGYINSFFKKEEITNSKEESHDQVESINLKSLVANQTFKEEILNDQKVILDYLNKVESSNSLAEKAGSGVVQRALSIISSGDMKIIDKNQDIVKSSSENLMPAASYLCHGARIVIEIPKGEGDDLFNWLTSGDKNKNGTSERKTQQDAIEEGKFVYNRYAATHGTKVDTDGSVSETKGFGIGAKDYFTSKGSEIISSSLEVFSKLVGLDAKTFVNTNIHDFDDSSVTNHYGIDLSLGIVDGKDKAGNEVNGPDGDHGHFYIYYNEATKDSPGTILLGIEGSSPDSPHHSKTGASDPFSPSYGSLWEDLGRKDKGDEYADCMIGSKYNGRKIVLSGSEIDQLVTINTNGLNNEKLATALPSTSVMSFLKNVAYTEVAEIVNNVKSDEYDLDGEYDLIEDYFPAPCTETDNETSEMGLVGSMEEMILVEDYFC